METTYKVIEIDTWDDAKYVVISLIKGKGNMYILMNSDELREFYFSGYTFKSTSYTPIAWWKSVAGLNIDKAISVEEQILFR